MGDVSIKERLASYQGLKFEYDTECDNWYERYVRLKNEQYIPAMREGDGSKRNPGASDRMGNATVRRIECEEQHQDEIGVIDGIKAKMRAIEELINTLPDPMHRAVLKQRYIVGGEGYCLKKWADITMSMYHRDDDTAQTRVRRLHRAAIEKLEEITNG